LRVAGSITSISQSHTQHHHIVTARLTTNEQIHTTYIQPHRLPSDGCAGTSVSTVSSSSSSSSTSDPSPSGIQTLITLHSPSILHRTLHLQIHTQPTAFLPKQRGHQPKPGAEGQETQISNHSVSFIVSASISLLSTTSSSSLTYSCRLVASLDASETADRSRAVCLAGPPTSQNIFLFANEAQL
jgi:hypothetical protein